MRNVLTRTASGIVYIALMVAAVFTQWVAVPLTFFLIVVGIRELYKMYETPELKVRYPFAIVAGLTMALAFLFASQFYLFVLGLPHEPGIRIKIFPYEGVLILLSVVAVFLPELFTRHENPVQNIGMGLLSLVWIVLPLSVLFFVWSVQCPAQVLGFFILIWMADTAAYVFGSLFGKHKLAPEISPGKTWEGFLGSCVVTVGLAVGLSYIPFFQSAGLKVWHWIVVALLTEVFGLLGDLLESMFKRKAGVKDSGNIIPGHGGVLDRVDSILFATLPVWLFCLMCDL
ncbi:MAG: phosphatidate cytidylyltransferase [Bacteroidales bacterium]|nr:phosphatidate cytidylyltransferase [Bacteroidales bacterium]